MKNLRKLSRTNLKEPGMPYDCGCRGLKWCPGMGACVHTNQIPRSQCETGL